VIWKGQPAFDNCCLSIIMVRSLFTLLLAAAVQIDARATGRNAVVVDASSVASSDYDYIIAGGGLAGLTIADRLTENPEGTLD
jgi:choline dehydrogenase